MIRTALRTTALAAVAALLGAGVAVRTDGAQLDLTAGLLLLGAAIVAFWALAELVLGLTSAAARTRGNVRTAIVTSGLLLVSLELLLRFGLGRYTTYLEAAEGGPYRPLYEGSAPTWFHVYSPNIEFTHTRGEFAFSRRTNSLGLCERELPMEKAAGEYRIIALGDSFTEGVGTAEDQTWLRVAATRLAAQAVSRGVTAFNAGISGSDPWHEYMLLREKLLDTRPDLVIVAINTSDISDVMVRGGRERFQPDGTTRSTRRPPSWEWLYGISYLFRHVVHDVLGYNYLFIKTGELPAMQAQAGDRIVAAVEAFAALGREHQFDLLVVLHPDAWEGRNRTYAAVFGALVDRVKGLQGIKTVDVLDYWKTSGLYDRVDPQALYWRLDGHNTPLGYAAFGEAVAARIRELRLIDGD